MRVLVVLLTLTAAALSISPSTTAAWTASTTTQQLPPVVLWAWERPTDLRDLPPDVGVAWLAQTIRVARLGLRVEPRRQPLRVDVTTPLIAVTRIESGGDAPTDTRTIERVAAQIQSTSTLPRVRAVQIDFDAVASERSFYRRLIVETRRRLGNRMPLSITALASWCADDRWLADLPIDEAVPMLFQMGADDDPYVATATSSRAAPPCRGALGVSLDEPRAIDTTHRRLYVFSNAGWSAATTRQAREIRP